MPTLDLNLLLALDALLQEASVTKAGQRLGLSTPATSHALARLREQLGDPVLVRAGRRMVLTPRAVELRPRIRALVEEAKQALATSTPFDPARLDRCFVVNASDYVLDLLGTEVDAALRTTAPLATLRFVPNTTDDAKSLREGESDLAVGIYGDLPPEMMHRQLLTDRFVCVVRERHPSVGKRLTLDQYVALPHLQVAPRGRPGGYIDDELHRLGHTRHVARAVPYFLTALRMVTSTDYVLTISERIARSHAASLGLKVLDAPLELRPYALNLVWHPRFDADEAHRFVREAFVTAAKLRAGTKHSNARTRLDATDPTTGRAPGRRRT